MKRRSGFTKVMMQLIALGLIFTGIGIPFAALIMQNEDQLALKEAELISKGIIEA